MYRGGDHGALVIQHAPAQDPSVLPAHGKGVPGPAFAGRHHVHMADGGQILAGFPAGQLGITDVAFAVVGVQAQPAGQLQGLVQGSPGTRAEGRALGGSGLHTVDGDQSPDVLEHLFLVGLQEGIYLLVQYLIHSIIFLSFKVCQNAARRGRRLGRPPRLSIPILTHFAAQC